MRQQYIISYVIGWMATCIWCVVPAAWAEDGAEHEVTCKANMQALGEALRLYIMLNEGKWPGTLSDLYEEGIANDLSLFTCPASGRILETADQIDTDSDYVMASERAQTPMLLFKEKYGYHNGKALAFYSDRKLKLIDTPTPPPRPRPQTYDLPSDLDEPANTNVNVNDSAVRSQIPTLPPVSAIPDIPPMDDPAIRHSHTGDPSPARTILPTSNTPNPQPTPPLPARPVADDVEARATELVKQGQTSWKAGKYTEAEKAFRDAIQLNPNDPQAHNGLGGALALQGHWDMAESSFRAAHQLEPNHYTYAGHLAIALMQQKKDYPEAEQLLVHAIQQKPDEADLYYQHGGVLRFQERWEESVAAYRRAIEIDSQQARYYADMTWSLIALDRREEARQAIARAKALGMSDHSTYSTVDKWGPAVASSSPPDPQNAPNLSSFTQLLWSGQYDKALQESRRLSDQYPDDAQVNVCRGLMELIYRENKAATTIAERLIQKYPDQINVIVLRAQTALWSGDAGTARKMFAKAMQLNPDTAMTYYQQGVQFYNYRLWPVAYYQFTTVLHLGGPGSTDAHYYLGIVCEQLNDPNQAISQYQAYLNATPTGQVADQARAALTRLKPTNR